MPLPDLTEQLSPEEEGNIQREYEHLAHWRLVLRPWLEVKRSEILERQRRLVLEDAPKNKFSVLTGELRVIEELFEYFEALRKR